MSRRRKHKGKRYEGPNGVIELSYEDLQALVAFYGGLKKQKEKLRALKEEPNGHSRTQSDVETSRVAR